MSTVESYSTELLIVDAAVTFFTNLLHGNKRWFSAWLIFTDGKNIEHLLKRRVSHSFCLAVAKHPKARPAKYNASKSSKDDNILNDTFFGLAILLGAQLDDGNALISLKSTTKSALRNNCWTMSKTLFHASKQFSGGWVNYWWKIMSQKCENYWQNATRSVSKIGDSNY